MGLDVGIDAAGDDLGGETARGRALAGGDDVSVEHQADLVGPAQVEMVLDGRLEPGPSEVGAVEHGGVGDLHLADRERPVEPRGAIRRGERAGQGGQPPADQVADMAGGEPGADAMGGFGVIDAP